MSALTRLLPALLAAAAGTAAVAQEASPDGFAASRSVQSREAVRAEAVAALREGRLDRGEVSAVEPRMAMSTRTRAEVRGEAAEALRLGLVLKGEYGLRDAMARRGS